ncbi:MAG: ribosome assembly RNA-binding protein YhbY [Chloroflexi bacterium AL-W]|nr:ribosome assembly RNA-binding protein YhbY [Chloroflexi bacterium AL-N1]NOK67467.1 ribosome assembly RNA-binding protein YhbY [Chloroflexi bacterium AL-N10]NOK75041.1 ribosome assembly RNA-binding protein YhbY [Chloroflexi bacterium AL-N5]NOK81828.1 ribosome assembly RNA-binding protein YhbY [Chloroflexi bacterium AL-W]NOK89674.1 ribosome assembly RNA-binding protein YhbY [Chloroflexi bacterium AL-N15]
MNNLVLTSAQRQHLRRLAHHLKPVVHVGKQGLTNNIYATLDRELSAHELIKIKFVDFQDQKKTMVDELVQESQSELIGIIGNIAILYRQHTDIGQRQVELPV